MFGNTKEEKQLELVVRGPPPGKPQMFNKVCVYSIERVQIDHFITMAKLLDLEPIMRTYLNSLENSEDEEEPHTIGGDEKF
jgi:hypothetical protein